MPDNDPLNKQEIAAQYAERGAVEGFEKVWPDMERRLKASLAARVAFKNEVLSQLIDLSNRKIERLQKRWENVDSYLDQVKQAQLEGSSRFYLWLTMFFWFAVLLGETIAFPFLYRDVFDLPLWVGIGFCALFPGASLFARGILYADLSDTDRRRFRHWLFGFWLFSLIAFTISFLTARSFVLANHRQMGTLSLSGSSVTGADSMMYLQLVSFCSLWLFGLSTAIGLAILHGHYRNPEDQNKLIEESKLATEQEMTNAIFEKSEHVRQSREAEADMESELLEIKNLVQTLILEKREERKMLAKKFPHLFGDVLHGNGRAAMPGGIALGAIVVVLLNPLRVFSTPSVVFIQDTTRPQEVVEHDFRGFGNTVLALPGGELILFGTDAVQYVHGHIEDTYQGKENRQRGAVIQQGRTFYLEIREQPSSERDYASALAEIIPRMREESYLIIQGRPLYRRGGIDWEGRIPSLSWIFSPHSPFGEHALIPATTKFRAAVVFSLGDFVSPNHRAAIQHFWSVLIARLNGELVLFTTDTGAVAALVSGNKVPSAVPQPDITRIPDEEKYGTLKLEGATVLGVQSP